MKRSLFLITLFSVLSLFAFAQDLNTVSVTDQFDTGERGNNTGSLTYGAPAVDGSEFADYTGADATGTIRYINGFGTDGSTETPILDCTTNQTNPDRAGLTIEAITANNRPGASNGSQVVYCGDDGGWNGLFFGESDDADYYVEIDAYCYDRHTHAADQYEAIHLVVRAARDSDPNMTDYSFNLDRAGSYGLVYDTYLQKVMAVKWTTGSSFADIAARVATTYEEFGSVSNVTEGWHTFRVECYQTKIRYYFDGTMIANVNDATFLNGRPGFGYREGGTGNSGAGVPSADETQGQFDNLKAGPFYIAPPAAAGVWTLYE